MFISVQRLVFPNVLLCIWKVLDPNINLYTNYPRSRDCVVQCFSTAGLQPSTGPSSYRKKNSPGHGLTEVENHWRSQYSEWLQAGRPRGRSLSPGRVKNFLFSTSLGSTQPPIQWVPGVKWLRHEAEHLPPASAKVKKMWIYTSTPPYAFMAQCLIS
jgi:hypothetical protein